MEWRKIIVTYEFLCVVVECDSGVTSSVYLTRGPPPHEAPTSLHVIEGLKYATVSRLRFKS